jgi:hypothetical protein
MGHPADVVIPAQAGLSTAELVIHLLSKFTSEIKMDSRFRWNDGSWGDMRCAILLYAAPQIIQQVDARDQAEKLLAIRHDRDMTGVEHRQ